ncbi:MAG: hypothetical protein HFI67_01655 [Lachnospiraceae bacterium]|jgi:hypothetical protein|nr:hypothetical protein [Lachnospiraceae bacterium]
MKMADNNTKLENLNEVSLMLNDLAVYLDRHPSDEQAAGWFETYHVTREEMLKELEKEIWK